MTNTTNTVTPENTENTQEPTEQELLQQEADSLGVVVNEDGTVSEKEETGENEENLILGKFKTQADLEKAYAELESKFSSRDAEKNEGEKNNKDSSDFKEYYGEGFSDLLSKGEVDLEKVNSEYQESGKLSEDTLSKLKQAGIGSKVLEVYFKGLEVMSQGSTDNSSNSAELEKQIKEVQNSFGGEEKLNSLLEWSKNNLSPQEIESYNNVANSGDLTMVQTLLKGFEARMISTEGYQGNLIQGKGTTPSADRFASVAQIQEAMSDPRYSKDPAYRESVDRKIANTPI